MKKSIRLIGVLLGLLFVLTACGESEEIESVEGVNWSDYTISYFEEDEVAKDSVSLLQETILNSNAEIVESVSENEINLEKMIYLGSEVLANKTNTVVDALGEFGYCITNDGESYYVYAISEKGFNRAFIYMDRYLFSEGTEVVMLGNNRILDIGDSCVDSISIGDKSIEEYTIVVEEDASDEMLEVAAIAQEYITNVSGTRIPILKTNENIKQAIQIVEVSSSSNNDFTYKYNISYGKIQLLGKDASACEEGVYDLLNTYFGWAFAGESNESISTRDKNLSIPDTVLLSEDTPWKEEREAIVCLWKTNFARGVYVNQNTTLLCDVMSYSDEQLYEYVKMLKQCGFTGIQVTEMCSAWAGSGDYDFVHERLRIMADAAHSMNMKFTLWIWGAEFSGYDWVDEDVKFEYDGYDYFYENPKVVEFVDEYYSIYAEMADCSDRVICHYYDPGNMGKSEDVGYFANMLKEKCLAVNPDIDFGVSCWVDAFDKEKLVEAMGNDITIYEKSHGHPVEMVNFRKNVDALECRLGTWSWGKAEMEIDQLATMSVNAEVLQEVYQFSRTIDLSYQEIASSYWSEMDSNHVMNVFSLYCAGHLLANPDADTEELLHQVSYETVGAEYENDFYEMLDLIQDARTGDSMETFIWGTENYIYVNDEKYDAEEILGRCNTYIPVLEQMIEEEIESNSLALPIDLVDVLRLMRQQLEQIKKFAEFRIAMSELEMNYNNGMSTSELALRLEEIYEPIPEYNGIIGLWGQVEARVQYTMIEEFCAELGIAIPNDPVFTYFRKLRVYQQLCSYQKGKQEPYIMGKTFFQWGVAYGEEATIALVDELIEEGLFTETEDEKVYLTDWENYIYDFK